ncbi:macro domain-containing protein [uncultured Lacinutrix sp.]|uniref:macro domain-containing protein n=1 Tax=uncultured Lacinutrix sp. TaxID=574032 RepID=UPI002627C1E0|nr:macro domain-containing protein [uncultured Lacinutrix sp.]
MKIKLIYIDNDLGKAWKKEFSMQDNVEIIKEDITKIKCDAVVSPANSFGFMDGSLDYVLSERFGWHIQEQLQKQIQESEEGELLVGQTITIKTGDNEVPFLISAPTMRVPMNFNIATSVNPYLAMKAILIACKKNEKINSVSIPGLCTGCGRMPYHIAAHQMYLAYEEIILGKKRIFKEFGDAQRFQYELNENGLIWHH